MTNFEIVHVLILFDLYLFHYQHEDRLPGSKIRFHRLNVYLLPDVQMLKLPMSVAYFEPCKSETILLPSTIDAISFKSVIACFRNASVPVKEVLIIKRICQQCTSKEIAAELHLRCRTAEDYRKKI